MQGQQGYPPQQNMGYNVAPQVYGNPMPTPGFPTSQAYPVPVQQQGFGNVQPNLGYPQPIPGYPQPSGLPQPAPINIQIGIPAPSYPQCAPGFPNQSYPPQSTMQNSTPQTVKPKSKPTVVPVDPFDPRADAAVLRKAMKGFGTDEKAIIQVLTKRTNEQRRKIASEFNTVFGRDLLADLKSETSGRFEDLLVALMTPLPQFCANELHDAMAGLGTDDEALIEILTGISNKDMKEVKEIYAAKYRKTLESDLQGDTSGDFRKLLSALCLGNRSEDLSVNKEQAKADAASLRKAAKGVGTDEETFFNIMCSRSFPQLAAIFQEFQTIAGHDIDRAIKEEFSFNTKTTLRAIVKMAQNPPLFFAERLQKSMKGLGTKDRQLIRIMVMRCEIDLQDIADIFQSKFGGTLRSWIEGDCSGDYRRCLLALLGQ